MYCKYCGKEIADDSKFCNYCGGIQEEMSRLDLSIKSRRWKPLRINKTAIADAIVVVVKELGFWILIMAVLYAIALGLIYGLGIKDDIASTIFFTPIVLIMLWRYVFRLIKWCVRWVNTNKSK